MKLIILAALVAAATALPMPSSDESLTNALLMALTQHVQKAQQQGAFPNRPDQLLVNIMSGATVGPNCKNYEITKRYLDEAAQQEGTTIDVKCGGDYGPTGTIWSEITIGSGATVKYEYIIHGGKYCVVPSGGGERNPACGEIVAQAGSCHGTTLAYLPIGYGYIGADIGHDCVDLSFLPPCP